MQLKNHRARTGALCGRLLAIAVAGSSIFLASTAGAASEIKIGGTGSALGAMHLLGDAFTRQNPDVNVIVVPNLGTRGAIKALRKGQLGIGLSSRPLTEEEDKLGAVAVEYARTPLVFAVATKSTVRALTIEQIADIYSGKTSNWPDGSQIRPVLHRAGDGTTRQLRRMSPMMDAAMTAAEKRPGIPFATTHQEATNKGENIPGAISITTLSMILSEGRQLRALTLDGIEPTAENGKAGRYVHAKHYFLIMQADPPPEAKRFADFVKSGSGREVLIRSGHWIP